MCTHNVCFCTEIDKNVYLDHKLSRAMLALAFSLYITKTRLFKYTENFTTKKMKIFRWGGRGVAWVQIT